MEVEHNSKTIRKLCRFFIVMGLIEIFALIFFTQNFLAIIPGLITIVPAYLTLHKNEMRRNYFVGIWPLIKFNPVTLGMIAFIMGDFLSTMGGVNMKAFNVFFISYFLIGIVSDIFGILLIVKIARHNRFIKSGMPVNEKNINRN